VILTVCLNPTLQKTLRFSSVVPGAVNRTAEHRFDVSGKGINVTRVLAQLGKTAVHLTQLGGDMRPLFLSLSKKDGLSVEWVESGCMTSHTGQIRFCYTILNESDGSVTELIEESEPVAAGTEERLLKKFDELLRKTCGKGDSHLIVSGTKAAGFSDAVIPAMVRKAKEKGLRVILDIKGKDLINSLEYEPDIIKPNIDEFTETFKIEPNKETLIDIAQKYRCSVILTNGSRNILAADETHNFFEVEVKPVKVVNSTACGDAFTAGLAAALEDALDFKAAIGEGIRCGSLNAGFIKPGVIH